jgi:hypothetical protein
LPFNIFVSYSSNDKTKIEPVLDQLSTIKETVIFFADWTINPDDEISQTILYNIQNSDVFIVFYSKSAIDSNYVQQEIGAAKSNDKIVIPILLDSSKPTGMLKGVNYLNFYDQTKKHIEIQRLYDFITDKIENKNKLKYALIILGILAFGYFLIKTISEKSSEKIKNKDVD